MLKPDTLIELTNLKSGAINYASIMDGEDSKFVTFIPKSRDEIIVNYRDWYDLVMSIINEGEYVYSLDIYDKAQRNDTYLSVQYSTEIYDFPKLANFIMEWTNG